MVFCSGFSVNRFVGQKRINGKLCETVNPKQKTINQKLDTAYSASMATLVLVPLQLPLLQLATQHSSWLPDSSEPPAICESSCSSRLPIVSLSRASGDTADFFMMIVLDC